MPPHLAPLAFFFVARFFSFLARRYVCGDWHDLSAHLAALEALLTACLDKDLLPPTNPVFALAYAPSSTPARYMHMYMRLHRAFIES